MYRRIVPLLILVIAVTATCAPTTRTAAEEPDRADFSGDGALDLLDVLAFQDDLARGVREPSNEILLTSDAIEPILRARIEQVRATQAVQTSLALELRLHADIAIRLQESAEGPR